MGDIKYHVLHRRRIATMAGACNVLEHNLRKNIFAGVHGDLEETESNIPDYINEDYMQYNIYEGSLSRNDFCADYQKKIDEAKLERKIQRNASRIIETVISASHSFCENWKTNPEEKAMVIQYLKDAVEWDRQEHGDTALSITYHFCESSPHAHILSAPLVEYIDKKTKEKKIKFSSSEFFGGKGELINMHTSFHEQVGKKYGLSRGQIGSRSSHRELKDYKSWEKEQRLLILEKERLLDNESSNIKQQLKRNSEKEETLLSRESDFEKREKKVRFDESVAKIKRDEFERIVVKSNQSAPTIPSPPISFSRSKLQTWVESVQENVTNTFRGIKAAYESLSDKYSHAVSEIHLLRSANKKLYEENLQVKNDLLNKPLLEIQAQREILNAKKKESETKHKENERDDHGKSR